MGDIIHSLPAVSALRASFPSAMIGWAIEERWAPLLSSPEARFAARGEGKPLVDILHIVNTRAWRNAWLSGETWREIKDTVTGLRAAQYDVAIDIQGAMKSAVLGRLARPRRRFGFAQPWEGAATMFYSHQVQPTGTHIADRNWSLATAAGATARPEHLFPIPIDPVAEAWADAKLRECGFKEFAIVNPGAGWGSKCWPAERFGEVAKRLATNGIASVINAGPGEEELGKAVENASGGAAMQLSTTLSELIALTRRATLFIGGDTGPLHLAVALNTPSVALFGPTDPARNGPYGGRAVVVRSPQSVTTYKRSAAMEGGLSSITAEEVLAAAGEILGKTIA